MMKRIIAHTLALVVAALTLLSCLTACGGSASGFTFKNNDGVEIAIGASADEVIDKLGAHQSMNESASCGGIPGNDRVYTYIGYRVKTTPAEGGNIICQVELTDDTLKTPEGVYIGMKAEDAKSAMSGKGTLETVGENLIYKSGEMKLQIIIRDGYVTGVQYVTA